MHKVVICEDNFIHIQTLSSLLYQLSLELSTEFEVKTFSSGEEMFNAKLCDIDLYFLDIQLGDLTGMDIARKLRMNNTESEIIFTTAVVDYIQEGYKVRAYRYLLKPLKYKELKETMISYLELKKLKSQKFMVVEWKGILNKILISDITYIEVRQKILTIHTEDEIYFTQNSISNIEKDLEVYNFFRCHKSYLVNMEHIQSIDKTIIKLKNEEIPVSKYRISKLKTKLTHLLGEIIC